jgi:hypothetical protein
VGERDPTARRDERLGLDRLVPVPGRKDRRREARALQYVIDEAALGLLFGVSAAIALLAPVGLGRPAPASR